MWNGLLGDEGQDKQEAGRRHCGRRDVRLPAQRHLLAQTPGCWRRCISTIHTHSPVYSHTAVGAVVGAAAATSCEVHREGFSRSP